MSLSHFQAEFEKMMNRDYFSSSIHPMRNEAFSKFNECGFPTQKWEDWQFTNLTSLQKDTFRISELKDGPTQKIDLSPFHIDNVANIVIYNGHFQKDISHFPSGINLMSGLDYLESKEWKYNNTYDSPFDLLNTAFMDSGMSVVIDENMTINTPIHMVFISNSNEPLMVNPRVHIDVGDSSSATFIEHHVGVSSSFFENGSIFINLEQNAQLNHIRIQSNSTKTISMANIQAEQSLDSKYTFFQYADGGQLGRLNMVTSLNGEGADCNLNGLALSKNNQHLDHHIITDHRVPHCTSSQNFKSILQDKSTGVFCGRTIVREQAQKTDSKQSNKNLLLSKNALMNSNPQLEIYADDVKCSHGSTTGELDHEALFYLRSRGIDMMEAKNLLTRGFANEIMNAIRHNCTRSFIDTKFKHWLGDEV